MGTLEGVNTETLHKFVSHHRRCVDGTASAIPGASSDTSTCGKPARAWLAPSPCCASSSQLDREGSTPRFEEAKSLSLHMCPVTGSQERRLHAWLSRCVAVGCRLLCHCRSPIHDLDRLDLHACMAVAATSGEQVREIGIYKIE